jgi:hypothetical protein
MASDSPGNTVSGSPAVNLTVDASEVGSDIALMEEV